MGTPMAVNFANLFMAKFETEMLADYKKELKKLPTVWLRYVEDIFFTWDYDEASLKHFINFCNNYSSNQNMKLNITFTADYSTSEVYFLDTKIKFKGERLISNYTQNLLHLFSIFTELSTTPLILFGQY